MAELILYCVNPRLKKPGSFVIILLKDKIQDITFSSCGELYMLLQFFSKLISENLTAPGFEPKTSGLTYRRSYQLSYSALYWQSPKWSTVFVPIGMPGEAIKPEMLCSQGPAPLDYDTNKFLLQTLCEIWISTQLLKSICVIRLFNSY